MRILFVNHTSTVSGAEHSLLTLLGVLPSESVAGLACPQGPLARMARECGVQVHPVAGTSGSLRLDPWRTPAAVAEIALTGVQVARAARRSGASVIHANSLRAGLVAGISHRLHRHGLVTHIRDCLPDSSITRLIRRSVAAETDELVAISEYVVGRFRAGICETDMPVRVIDDPIDLGRFRPNRRKHDSARLHNEPVLAIIGQISSWKGHDTAIRALYDLRRRHQNARLLIVGEIKFAGAATRLDNRGYRAELHKLVSDLRLVGAVEFVGEREDVPDIMANADVILVPSIEEPFGRTVAEAMAVETPVVATTIGGPAELIDNGTTGLLVPPADPVAWSEAITSILEKPGWAREMARRGGDIARQRFAPERHAAAMLEIYRLAQTGSRI